MKRVKTADDYFENAEQWRDELIRLRSIIQETPLCEEIKWGGPCYTLGGKNIVMIGGFKSYFGLWFYQGALLADKKAVLINAQEGKTKALRQWRMTSAKEIKPALIRSYVAEAMELAEKGREIAPARNKRLILPTVLKAALSKNKKAGESFKKLKPGLRREYANYVGEAKRDDTKIRRVEKILPMIASGAGLNDKYRR